MIRDFKKSLTGFDGKELTDSDKPITLGIICVNALRGTFKGEEDLSGVEKEKRYRLARKIYDQGEVEVSAEEITLLKTLIGKGYPVDIVGPAYELLEED